MLLEQSIFETVAYFDIFDYPLRANEIKNWLWKIKADLKDVVITLQTSEFLKERLSSKDGFFYLKGREENIKKRLERYRFAETKYKKAVKFIKIFSICPFVRAVAVCNDLGYGNSPEEGDIDLFVITAKNRSWFVRAKIAGFLKFFRLRPGETKINPICASFYIDENNLNLRELAAVNPPEQDIHFAYWINQMTPVFANPAEALAKADGTNDIWQKFCGENKWARDLIPNADSFVTNPVRVVNPSIFQKIFELFLFGFIGDFFEKICKSLQLKFLPPQIRDKMNKNTNVVIRDGVLKMHTNDRRKFYFEEFQNKISNYQYPISNSQ